jgi:uncharacterized membrane protein HdeD (DUF308 family)
MINGNKIKNAFGISSVIVGCIILPISFFPFSIPLIIVGSYFLLNGISNIIIKI